MSSLTIDIDPDDIKVPCPFPHAEERWASCKGPTGFPCYGGGSPFNKPTIRLTDYLEWVAVAVAEVQAQDD